MLLDGLTGESDVHHCAHTATFLLTSLDCHPAVTVATRSALANALLAVSLTACGGASR
jgi:hypothetical protein